MIQWAERALARPGKMRFPHMSESHGSATRVDNGSVQAENLLRSADNDAECLVEFPQRDVGLRDAGGLESQRNSKSRSSRKVDRCARGVGIACGTAGLAKGMRQGEQRNVRYQVLRTKDLS